MLFSITSTVDYLGFSIALWLAFYLLARGFPSRVTLRTVVVLLALATFFLSASINLYLRIPGATAIRAILLVTGLSTWYDLTHKLLPQQVQDRTRWLVYLGYILGIPIIVLLFGTRNAFIHETSNILYVGRMNLGPVYVVYGIYQVFTSLGILNNFRLGAKNGVGKQNRYFFISSALAISTVGYGIFALAITPPMPRVIQDGLVLASIVILGISVARYQTLMERRTTIQDFPISFLAVFSLSAVFAVFAWFWSSSPVAVNLVTALAILTHAFYDLVREFLERQRYKNESHFHRQLRQLKHNDQENLSLQERISTGLTLLCKVLSASGGFVAMRMNDKFVVIASHFSLPIGSEFAVSDVISDEIQRPATVLLKNVDWIAPAIENHERVAVIGIGPSKSKNEYSTEDIDMLAEVADRVGSIVHLHNDRNARPPHVTEDAGATRSDGRDLDAESDQLLSALTSSPNPEFVKIVEEALRNLADTIKLGESPLTKQLNFKEETQIECGRAVRDQLVRAIEMLKPDQPRPSEPLPREWYNYVVLYDAYVKDVPNREIMARMYVSEGTFNRSRRNALRGVARYLLEQKK